MTLLVIYFLVAIGVSFLCSVLEAVLLSITPSYVHSLQATGKSYAKRLEKLKRNIDKPLSAILSLNTIAHTIGAAGVGAQAALVFGDNYIGIISAVLTFLILVLSEIIPKSIGANYWKSLAKYVAVIMYIVIYLMYPLVLLSRFLTRLLSRGSKPYSTSREEVIALAQIGQQEGIFRKNESQIIKNLMYFQTIKIENAMTPRTVILAADEEMTLDEFFANKEFFRFSRIPVFRENIDNIKGYVLKAELLEKLVQDRHDLKLKDIKREMVVFYEKSSILHVFEVMIQKREHISLIVDEYGGVSGIATMEDIIETLLGMEIIDEFDKNVDMQQLARDRWRARALKLGIIQDGEGANRK